MTKAISYMRCSGMGQTSGDTWERQRAAINGYAQTNGIEIIAEFRDEGVSGKIELENRPGLAACIERIENNGVKLILVESADRLARDSMIAELIIREVQKAGGIVIAASGGVDLTAGNDSNPTAQLIRQILAAVAQFDRCVTVLKLRAARDRKRKENGRCEGRKAYGELPGEASTLDAIQQMKSRGMAADKIAENLNANEHFGRSGRPWRGSVVRKILARQSCASDSRNSLNLEIVPTEESVR